MKNRFIDKPIMKYRIGIPITILSYLWGKLHPSINSLNFRKYSFLVKIQSIFLQLE